jgi:kinesin family member 1
MYAHSNEIEEKGVVNLSGVNVESNPDMEMLLRVRSSASFFCFANLANQIKTLQKRFTFTLFTASNSYALAAPSTKELMSWTSKLDPTRSLS